MRRVHAIVFCVALALLSLTSLGCTKQARLEATAISLNSVASGVDIAWALALQTALSEEEAFIERVDSSETTLEQARNRLREIRAGWDDKFRKFRAIRDAHETAVAVFEQVRAGKASLGKLLVALRSVLALYDELREQLDLPAVPESAAEVIP